MGSLELIKLLFMKTVLKILGATMIVALFVLEVPTAHANPSQFIAPVSFAAATSSLAYMATGGSATSTAFDSFTAGQPLSINNGVLLLQNVGSSTSSVLNIRFQYSADNIDWYEDELMNITNASTTQPYSINNPNSYNWTAASVATTSKAIIMNFPTRYVRAIFAESGAAGGVWWQFIPQRERSE